MSELAMNVSVPQVSSPEKEAARALRIFDNSIRLIATNASRVAYPVAGAFGRIKGVSEYVNPADYELNRACLEKIVGTIASVAYSRGFEDAQKLHAPEQEIIEISDVVEDAK